MKATSYRLPEATLDQIRRLAAERGMTATQVLVVAIDRMARECADSGVADDYYREPRLHGRHVGRSCYVAP